MQSSSVIALALRDKQPMSRISDKIFKDPNLPIKEQRQTPRNTCFLVLPPKHIKLYIKTKLSNILLSIWSIFILKAYLQHILF